MSYYTINEDAARLSKELSSFSDYKAGSATASYRAQVDEAAATLEKVKALCVTEAQRDRAEYLFDRYAATLAQAINRDNEIGTRCPSVMISGPANFPTRKKEKQLAAWAAKESTHEDEEHDGYTYHEDAEQMRVQLIFDGKPDDATRELLKNYGFRWSPRNSAWQRQLTANGKRAARLVMKELDARSDNPA